MTKLEQREWRALSKTDRARFLVMLRQAYSAEREMMLRRRNGSDTHGGGESRLVDLSLTEADFREVAPLVHLPRRSAAKGADVGF